MIKKSFNSLVYALRGVVTVWKEENSFRIGVVIAVLVTFLAYYFSFTFIESAFCAVAITLVLCAEIINTAVEDLCNKVEPNQDPLIRKIKDISAGFVVMSVIGAFALGLLVFYNHFV